MIESKQEKIIRLTPTDTKDTIIMFDMCSFQDMVKEARKQINGQKITVDADGAVLELTNEKVTLFRNK